MANTNIITLPSRVHPAYLRPGDVVLTESRIGPVIKHLGLVHVVERDRIWVAHNQKQEGPQVTPLADFLGDGELYLLERPAIASIAEVQERVRRLVYREWLPYHPLNWTCEDFVAAALGRAPRSQQRRELVAVLFELAAVAGGQTRGKRARAEFRESLDIPAPYGPLLFLEASFSASEGEHRPAVPQLTGQVQRARKQRLSNGLDVTRQRARGRA